MIKAISFLRPAASAEAFERLSSFFAALGFAPGKGWQEAESRGAIFLAPSGRLELIDGRFPDAAEILVEVTSLDSIYQATETWLKAQSGETATRLSPIAETDWQSRLFTVEPTPGFCDLVLGLDRSAAIEARGN